jgi:histone H3/H4
MDLARNTKSIFRGIAPAEQKDIEVEWHGRTIKGRVYMRDLLDIASKGQALPPINTADTDHDFTVFVSNRPCGDKVTDLAKRVGDPRTLFWTPAQLTSQEKDRLLDFAACRDLIKDYQHKDTEDAKEVVQWVANRLRDEIGSTAKIVADSFGRGQISATDHSNMKFTCQGELLAILTPLVGHVLDGVYLSKNTEFDAPAPFNDAEAIKVVNGVVKTGDIPKGTKPNQYTSAADNYGYALGIMKKDGTKQLNTKGNEFVEDLEEWIETQTSQGNQQISVETVCKNFTGMGGPNDKNYGLSRRMIDIYLLCLVREGKLRILLSGKGAATAEYIDYTNIADLTFNAALLNSMTKVQRLKAPEGWPVLAPFAAILLDDDSLKSIQKDGDITAALDRLRKWREQGRSDVMTLIERFDTLMADIQQTNPVAGDLSSWKAFLFEQIDDSEAISQLLHALDTSFAYTCYAQQEAKATELDDLATRRKTWAKADAFCRHDQRIRAAYCYSQLQVKKDGPVGELKDKLRSLGKKLDKIGDLMESEAKLQSELLDTLDNVQGTYKTRYLQAFDKVTGKCEQVRSEIDKLPDSRPFQAIAQLVTVDALASVNIDMLKMTVAGHKDGLFQSSMDRNAVDAGLKHRPQPEGCSLHIDEADQLVARAEDALEKAKAEVHTALVNIANLLRQPALRTLLEQGKQEQFIADVLAAPDDNKLADALAECISAHPAHAKLLAKYLKKIVVKVIHLQEFHPSKTTIEKGDIETVVNEFRTFLETAVVGDGKSQSTILEIK